MSGHVSKRSLLLGSFVHSKSLTELEFLHDSAIAVDEKGVIVALEQRCDQKKAEETLLPKLGWSIGEVTVRIARPGQFFFPGFIGPFLPLFFRIWLTVFRYPHSCLSISQCRDLWQDDSARLVEYLHFPYGEQPVVSSQSQDSLHEMYSTNTVPRHYYCLLLCNNLRPIHQSPS